MIRQWLRKRKLVALIEELAIYNDKGIAWRRHNQAQQEAERDRLMGLIQIQVAKIGAEKIQNSLLKAVEEGSLRTDITGEYISYAKATEL